MKVITSEDNLVEFDNGIKIVGEGDDDCCAINYIDFEQFVVGAEFPTMTLGQLTDAINLKEDGFALTDSQGLPKWAQARSQQNGYYSNNTTITIEHDGKKVILGAISGEIY